jgi:hypothetical protein
MISIRLERFSYRFAEQVLNSKLALKQEVEAILTSEAIEVASLSRPNFNKVLKDSFVARGWHDMLNNDFDTVLDLCAEQHQVHRERQALPKDQRAQLEREQKRLEGAINRLLDRQILRKCGITSIIVRPDGNGWRFEGQADFRGAVHPRTHEGPSRPPSTS